MESAPHQRRRRRYDVVVAEPTLVSAGRSAEVAPHEKVLPNGTAPPMGFRLEHQTKTRDQETRRQRRHPAKAVSATPAQTATASGSGTAVIHSE